MDPRQLCYENGEVNPDYNRFMQCRQDYPSLMRFMELFASAYGMLGLIVCSLSVISNIMNLVILSKRWLRRPTTSILIGIAAMDLCVSLSQMPILLRYYLAPSSSYYHTHDLSEECSLTIQNSSLNETNNLKNVTPGCPHIARIVSRKDFGWVCNHTYVPLSKWSVAFVFIFAQCISLTSHTTSVWFGALLALFRWWLVSQLSRKVNRIRQTINLAQRSIHLASTVIAQSDIQLSRVCVNCGRTVILINGTHRNSSTESTTNQNDTCDQCISLEPFDKPLAYRNSDKSIVNKMFHRTHVTFPSRESLTDQRLNKRHSHEQRSIVPAPGCLTQFGRFCCRRTHGVQLSRTNTHRVLCLVFLIVSLLLSPYFMTIYIRAAYYILMPCETLKNWRQPLTHHEKVLHFCVDNATYTRVLLAGYIPVRREDSVLDSYNFWIIAGLGKLTPCCLIAIFGFRLLTHLRQNISHQLSFSGHVAYSHSPYVPVGLTNTKSFKKRVRNHRRTSRLLILVILLILPVELPAAILLIGKRYTYQGECLYVSLGDLLDCLTLVKNTLTFVIYCSMSSEFRTAFCDTIKRLKHFGCKLCITCGLLSTRNI